MGCSPHTAQNMRRTLIPSRVHCFEYTHCQDPGGVTADPKDPILRKTRARIWARKPENLQRLFKYTELSESNSDVFGTTETGRCLCEGGLSILQRINTVNEKIFTKNYSLLGKQRKHEDNRHDHTPQESKFRLRCAKEVHLSLPDEAKLKLQ